MNNEPVAWFYAYPDDVEDKFLCGNTELIESMKSCGKDYIITPLYTHPSEHDLGIAEAIGFEKGHKSAEDMLRQQQAEIEALKAGKIRAYDNGVEDGRKPNTNLVKELTDEEILECWNETHPAVVCLNAELPLFARAILRKAQDK